MKPSCRLPSVRSSNRILALSGLMLLLGACNTLGPDFQTPQVPMPTDWQHRQSRMLDNQRVPDSQWWRLFQDPVLDGLIETARQQNLSLQMAATRIWETRAQLGIATGNQYPQSQQLSGSYTRAKVSPNAAPLGELPDSFKSLMNSNQDLYDVGFDAVWELDFWGKFRRGVESARANLQASEALSKCVGFFDR